METPVRNKMGIQRKLRSAYHMSKMTQICDYAEEREYMLVSQLGPDFDFFLESLHTR